MRVLITGGSGLIGQGLRSMLSAAGDEVLLLSRTPAVPGRSIHWEPESGVLAAGDLEGFDAIVHLAGSNIGAGRWNQARKAELVRSRLGSTELLTRTFEKLASPPKVLVAASATGYYGDRGEERLTEASGPGDGFLSQLCVDWEAAAMAASSYGIRTVLMRIGVVLSPNGGALARMLPLYRSGLGGKLGSGSQYWSWISYDDLLSALSMALTNVDLHGPVNLVAPTPVTNAEFNAMLAKKLHRPAFFTVPRFVMRLAMGEMADALLLASSRVEPARLIRAGYRFQHPDLPSALTALLS